MAVSELAKSERRSQRNRTRLKKAANGRLRLCVTRSSKHITAQLIDDAEGKTVVTASTQEKAFRDAHRTGGNAEAAGVVGAWIAERAKAKGVGAVMFDRGGYLYHGRVKALAEAAREGGLDF
jgi:large subunit ribosomal protein L18